MGLDLGIVQGPDGRKMVVLQASGDMAQIVLQLASDADYEERLTKLVEGLCDVLDEMRKTENLTAAE